MVTVNGQVAPELAARPGTVQRWRLLNASTARFYRLALERHALWVIGTDGGLLDKPYAVAGAAAVAGRARGRPRQGRDDAGHLSAAHPAVLPGRHDGRDDGRHDGRRHDGRRQRHRGPPSSRSAARAAGRQERCPRSSTPRRGARDPTWAPQSAVASCSAWAWAAAPSTAATSTSTPWSCARRCPPRAMPGSSGRSTTPRAWTIPGTSTPTTPRWCRSAAVMRATPPCTRRRRPGRTRSSCRAAGA